MTKVCPSSSRNLKRADANFQPMQYPDFLMVHLQKIAGLLISARATATLLLTSKEFIGFVIHTVRKTKIR
jgi:hypothetical protein